MKVLPPQGGRGPSGQGGPGVLLRAAGAGGADAFILFRHTHVRFSFDLPSRPQG